MNDMKDEDLIKHLEEVGQKLGDYFNVLETRITILEKGTVLLGRQVIDLHTRLNELNTRLNELTKINDNEVKH